MPHAWQPRSSNRLPDSEWDVTIRRIRAEFGEMPGLRVTPAQARVLFGLSDSVSDSILNRLADEGYLDWRDGLYGRRYAEP